MKNTSDIDLFLAHPENFSSLNICTSSVQELQRLCGSIKSTTLYADIEFIYKEEEKYEPGSLRHTISKFKMQDRGKWNPLFNYCDLIDSDSCEYNDKGKSLVRQIETKVTQNKEKFMEQLNNKFQDNIMQLSKGVIDLIFSYSELKDLVCLNMS